LCQIGEERSSLFYSALPSRRREPLSLFHSAVLSRRGELLLSLLLGRAIGSAEQEKRAPLYVLFCATGYFMCGLAECA